MRQQTLKKSVSTKGVGIHSGKIVTMVLSPAPENTGVVFVRVDLKTPVSITAKNSHVCRTQMSTNLCKDGANVNTIEHLLAALCIMGIDNAIVELDNEEVPILDGSAAAYCLLVKQAGIEKQNAFRKCLRIEKSVRVGDENAWAEISPFDGFALDFEIEFDHPSIKRSTHSINVFSQNAEVEISKARTFGFLKDVEYLHSRNLALGASKQNAIILDEYGIANNEELRYPNEFVRHKILDAMGDLYASGYQILGHYKGYRAGHQLNYQLVSAVLQQNAALVHVCKNSIPYPKTSNLQNGNVVVDI